MGETPCSVFNIASLNGWSFTMDCIACKTSFTVQLSIHNLSWGGDCGKKQTGQYQTLGTHVFVHTLERVNDFSFPVNQNDVAVSPHDFRYQRAGEPNRPIRCKLQIEEQLHAQFCLMHPVSFAPPSFYAAAYTAWEVVWDFQAHVP